MGIVKSIRVEKREVGGVVYFIISINSSVAGRFSILLTLVQVLDMFGGAEKSEMIFDITSTTSGNTIEGVIKLNKVCDENIYSCFIKLLLLIKKGKFRDYCQLNQFLLHQ